MLKLKPTEPMKKFIIVAAIALGFASCSGGAEEAQTTPDSTAVAVDTTACVTTTCVADSAKCDTIK